MRVLHVLHTSLPTVCGYTIRSKYILAHQQALGLTPGVVSSPRQTEGHDGQVIDGVVHMRTPPVPRSLEPDVWAMMRALAGRLEQAVASWQPDLIHAHSPVLVGLASLWVARRHHLPLVYEVRDLWENASVDRGKFKHGSVAYRLARALESVVLREADAVVTICQPLQAALAPRVGASTTLDVIANGVEAGTAPSEPEALAARLGLTSGRRIGYLGTFQPYEGLHVLIAAMPRILAHAPDTRLVIAGRGELEPVLRQQVASMGLQQRVFFPGLIAHQDVASFYQAMDVLVYPRVRTLTTELTTPLKPLEAMVWARAVLASDVPGLLELVRPHETGLDFRAGDAESLAERCCYLLEDATLRASLGLRAREWVLRNRQWPDLVAGYVPIYEQAARKKSARVRALRPVPAPASAPVSVLPASNAVAMSMQPESARFDAI